MKVQDEIDEVIGDSRYIKHFLECKSTKDNYSIVTLEYWCRIGNTTMCVRHMKQFIVKDYGKPTEIAWEDMASPSALVRTRWY